MDFVLSEYQLQAKDFRSRDLLLEWYQIHHRILPWRENSDPYRVWISEIMLQQTRVEAVKPYFERFLKTCPDLASLATVDDDILMKLWEGLGYYSRARNLKKSAQIILREYQGRIPEEISELRKLPGIGNYTSGAIRSIAYGKKASAVDGNVMRVFARYLGFYDDILEDTTKKQVERIAYELCPETNAGVYTQSLIELGALICVPNGTAKCSECPLNQSCCSFAEKLTEILPVRNKKVKRKTEERTVLVLREAEHFLVRKRPSKGLLSGLYELPNYSGNLSSEELIEKARSLGFEPLKIEPIGKAKHLFSHIEWDMNGWLLTGYFDRTPEGELSDREELDRKYAVPSAFSCYTTYIRSLLPLTEDQKKS